MTKNFLNLVKEKDTQVHDIQRVSNKLDTKRPTHRQVIIKIIIQRKERILKDIREKQVVTYKRIPIKLSSDFSTETFQARRERHEIFKVMKSKDLQLRLLYQAMLTFKMEKETRGFPHTQKRLKEHVSTKPVLQQMLKGLL